MTSPAGYRASTTSATSRCTGGYGLIAGATGGCRVGQAVEVQLDRGRPRRQPEPLDDRGRQFAGVADRPVADPDARAAPRVPRRLVARRRPAARRRRPRRSGGRSSIASAQPARPPGAPPARALRRSGQHDRQVQRLVGQRGVQHGQRRRGRAVLSTAGSGGRGRVAARQEHRADLEHRAGRGCRERGCAAPCPAVRAAAWCASAAGRRPAGWPAPPRRRRTSSAARPARRVRQRR